MKARLETLAAQAAKPKLLELAFGSVVHQYHCRPPSRARSTNSPRSREAAPVAPKLVLFSALPPWRCWPPSRCPSACWRWRGRSSPPSPFPRRRSASSFRTPTSSGA
jgi:hypothetical protein